MQLPLCAHAEYAMDGDTSTTHCDWRLPSIEEAAVFEGTVTNPYFIWTATSGGGSIEDYTWLEIALSDGDWSRNRFYHDDYVRCVR